MSLVSEPTTAAQSGGDPVIEALDAASAALVAGDPVGAAAALDRIAAPMPQPYLRRPLPIPLIAQVFKRDHFICRYCETWTIPTAVLRAISSVPVLQVRLPYHRSKRVDSTHPIYRSHGATCDHIEPVVLGGPDRDIDNLVTACWACNRTKADQRLEDTKITLAPIASVDWDGLTGRYRAIWDAAGRPDESFHRHWMKAFDV
jgi:hypothetical protein